MSPGQEVERSPLEGPLKLFDHWERHQWSLRDLQPENDRGAWQSLSPMIRQQLRNHMIEFFIGEFSVTETLAPLSYAAPDKDSQVFLCTQLADEARHSLFFHRYLAMVDDSRPSTDLRLASAWTEASEGQVELFDKRLRQATDRVRVDPTDRSSWYEGITLYHLVLEGVLATSGQRLMLRMAKYFDELQVLSAGLTSVSRDESRHVAFGVHALRQAVGGGYADNVIRVVTESIGPMVEMVVQPKRSAPMLAHRGGIEYTVYGWEVARRNLEKRLRAVGLQDVAAELDAVWREQFALMLDAYETAHGQPHPARGRWIDVVAQAV